MNTVLKIPTIAGEQMVLNIFYYMVCACVVEHVLLRPTLRACVAAWDVPIEISFQQSTFNIIRETM